ncbi:MAG: hypothetical protein LBG52_05070 [Candidatus Peribacteria bacterium]|jgi:hypothetical protein|nr:hypothetical protein [Candidatus Peribacteria bacterium]
MFIENNYAGTFLVKKIAQQKISVKFDPENTVEQTLEAITQRECDLIFTQSSYKHFEQQIHNASVLPDLVIQSKFLLNIIEFIHFMQQSNLLSQPLDQQSNSLVERLEEGFPVEFIYHSNTIEGSKISKENVAKIMQHQKLTYKVKKEIKEVENSIKARTFLQSDFIWNIANIKKLYHILTKDLLQETGIPYPRGFKKIPITVNNTATTDPQQVKKAV